MSDNISNSLSRSALIGIIIGVAGGGIGVGVGMSLRQQSSATAPAPVPEAPVLKPILGSKPTLAGRPKLDRGRLVGKWKTLGYVSSWEFKADGTGQAFPWSWSEYGGSLDKKLPGGNMKWTLEGDICAINIGGKQFRYRASEFSPNYPDAGRWTFMSLEPFAQDATCYVILDPFKEN